jgi:hypothetical protein
VCLYWLFDVVSIVSGAFSVLSFCPMRLSPLLRVRLLMQTIKVNRFKPNYWSRYSDLQVLQLCQHSDVLMRVGRI